MRRIRLASLIQHLFLDPNSVRVINGDVATASMIFGLVNFA